MELIDENLSESHRLYEVLRSIEVVLLNLEDRPTMSSVVVMLSNESQLPQPKQRGFFYTEHAPQDDMSFSTHAPSSTTAITITLVYGS
uniref:S-locus receptor kinase C-terminal domain-containing protein n=1 Tax=Lactuca sativa TaxID=4236 RepID=A0A9R1VF20_LACSA|nr:hypothetical protein LSAT_V11C500230920 [Lactuca sativa]